MRLKIIHRTEYAYDAPLHYALQRLRLTPASGPTQTVRSWSLDIEGAREEVCFRDQFENETRLISVEGAPHRIVVQVSGVVDTLDTAGVYGTRCGFAPLWLFCHETPLTRPGKGVEELAVMAGEGSELDRLHRLMALIRDRVSYTAGTTTTHTTAEEALAQGAGVCQDHSHVFVSAARAMGFPARYVSGYLMMEGTVEQTASHAWAEAFVPKLGWVGFDASNGISPDQRYVRIAVGRDYQDAMPISGIRLGQAEERLAVAITVEQ